MDRRAETSPSSNEMPLGRVVVHSTEDEFLGHVRQNTAVVIEEDPRRSDPIFGIAHDNASEHYGSYGEGDNESVAGARE